MSEVADGAAPRGGGRLRAPRPGCPGRTPGPWLGSSRGAPALSSAVTGANSIPSEGMPTISSAISHPAGTTTGAGRLTATAPDHALEHRRRPPRPTRGPGVSLRRAYGATVAGQVMPAAQVHARPAPG